MRDGGDGFIYDLLVVALAIGKVKGVVAEMRNGTEEVELFEDLVFAFDDGVYQVVGSLFEV